MTRSDSAITPCPCDTGNHYHRCCQPYHQGQTAPSPQALMRARYSAFVLELSDYLLQSWHPSTRPHNLDLQGSPRWCSLQVIASGTQGAQGEVHFRAIHRAGDQWLYLEERSVFVQENGHWYYLSGDTREGTLKPARNQPCPCGSGRKYKTCCH